MVVCGVYGMFSNWQLDTLSLYEEPCSESFVHVGKKPRFLFNLVNDPDLNAGERKDPILAADFKKSTTWSKPDQTIVMSVYNSARSLQESIPVLFTHTTGFWELILVLDSCYDESYVLVVQMTKTYFKLSSAVRVRIVIQPTAVWEVSSDNLGMRMSSPSKVYIILQAVNIIHEHSWNQKMYSIMMTNNKIFAISGRCGHNFDGSDVVLVPL